jgi:tetratricopeptide (TPR) repeat protein
MLFQMITGRLPFSGRTWQEFENLHKTQSLPELKTHFLELKAIIQTCLAKDPAQRFADFSKVREQLTDIYKELTGQTAPQPVLGDELGVVQWFNKGVSLDALGRSEEALVCYDRALAINPQYAQAWYNKGVVFANSFQLYREALECFENAHRLGIHQAAQGITLCRRMLG